jgi:hypothetical protein
MVGSKESRINAKKIAIKRLSEIGANTSQLN